MTSLFEPFAPLFELTRDVERLLEPRGGVPSFLPPADVVVTDDEVTVIMDVPGLKVDDLSIELQDEVLTVRGDRPFPYGGDADAQQRPLAWQRLERGFGRFERVLRVPQGLHADRISASIANGVLTLVLPKPQQQKPRRIQITTSDAHAGEGGPAIEGTASESEPRELAGAKA